MSRTPPVVSLFRSLSSRLVALLICCQGVLIMMFPPPPPLHRLLKPRGFAQETPGWRNVWRCWRWPWRRRLTERWTDTSSKSRFFSVLNTGKKEPLFPVCSSFYYQHQSFITELLMLVLSTSPLVINYSSPLSLHVIIGVSFSWIHSRTRLLGKKIVFKHRRLQTATWQNIKLQAKHCF